VDHGVHLLYWDSEMESMLVNNRNMEVQNHWGPVDAGAQLPAERIAEFFGRKASYYAPPNKQVGSQFTLLRRVGGGVGLGFLGFLLADPIQDLDTCPRCSELHNPVGGGDETAEQWGNQRMTRGGQTMMYESRSILSACGRTAGKCLAVRCF
jgi:hypothetical protein